MLNAHRRAAIGLLAILLSACAGAGSGQSPTGPSSDPVASASATTSATAGPSGAPAGSADAVPSEDLGPFTCDLPIVEDPTAAIANIVDVRVGAHEGYDRVVFEFEQGTPEFTLDRAVPPFTADGSGLPVEVSGDSFVGLVMRGGTKQTEEGTSSYDGPTNFDPELAALVDLVEGGDFERQSTWYLGLRAESCLRVLLLDGPPRLVIDVEHP